MYTHIHIYIHIYIYIYISPIYRLYIAICDVDNDIRCDDVLPLTSSPNE